MPPSPWIGSIRIAQVSPSISLAAASRSPNGAWTKPASIGPTPWWYLGCPVALERADGSAVKAVEHREDLVAAGLAVEAGELDGGLIGLGAAVAEEALGVQAAARDERLREQALGFHVPGVWYVNQPGHLLLHRADDARRAMAEQVAAPAGEEVEVALALGVPDVGALAANQAHRVAAIIADDVLIEQLDRILAGHRGIHPMLSASRRAGCWSPGFSRQRPAKAGTPTPRPTGRSGR